jgi:protein-disulfide isomerase
MTENENRDNQTQTANNTGEHAHHHADHAHMDHHHDMSSHKAPKDRSGLYTPLAIVIAGVLIAVGLFLGLSHGSTTAATAGTQAAPSAAVNIADVKTAGDPYIGQANAPVVMAFWSDYQCPYCRAFEVGGIPQITTPAAFPDLVKNYVDTGKLKVVFKDFQFLGQDSIDDGEYARAVWALYPQQFFTWREAMYNQQPEENSLSEAANKAHIEKVTQSVSGISLAAVEADIAKNKSTYDAAMQADETEGESFGIQGTPGFIIGTTLISGAQAESQFITAINAQLKN